MKLPLIDWRKRQVNIGLKEKNHENFCYLFNSHFFIDTKLLRL